MKTVALAALALAIVLLAPAAEAAWSHDPAENTRIPYFPGNAHSGQIVSPGQGETIVAWIAEQGDDRRIFAQRLDPDGEKLWGTTGLQVADPSGWVSDLTITDDGNGGIFLAWVNRDDAEPGLAYAQHVTFQGDVTWATPGVRVCTYDVDQNDPSIVVDGAGGLYVVWCDGESPNTNIYGMRLGPTGARLWNPTGVAICSTTGDQYLPRIVRDGAGGIHVAWNDRRDGLDDLYAQRMSSAGLALWTGQGVAVDVGDNAQVAQRLATTDDHELLLVYRDGFEVAAQKVDADGILQWAEGGLELPGPYPYSSVPELRPVGDGGLVTAFENWNGAETESRIVAHRVSGDGRLLWSAEGITIAVGEFAGLTDPCVDTLTDGSYVVAYRDGFARQQKAQRLDVTGASLWPAGPRAFTTGSWFAGTPKIAAVLDDAFVAVWSDHRTGESQVYAQYVDANGFCGDNRPVISAVTDRPADQGGEVIVDWQASWLDAIPAREIARYTIWFQPHADGRGVTDRATDLATALNMPPRRVASLLRDGWTFGLEVPAAEFDEYAAFAPTLGDSSDTGWPWFDYLVIAHGQETWRLWPADPVAGYSVDNLEPGLPGGLVVAYEYPDGASLSWLPNQEDDLRGYRIYRGDSEDFEVGPETLVDETAETGWTSPELHGFYRITAVDQHGNESPPADPEQVVGVSGEVLPEALALHPCTPNPFNPATTIRFDVPAPGGRIQLEVFDLTGRRVRVLADAFHAPGRHEIRWTGTDDRGRAVSSGVYVSRLTRGGETRTGKMLLTR